MGKIIFILGGVRSGKSSYAVDLAKKLRKKTAFIATCTSPDSEMKQRIKTHKKKRPRYWKLIEEGRDINAVLFKLNDKHELVLIDCLGLLISNLMAEGLKDKMIETKLRRFVNVLPKFNLTIILVSNEAGTGVVPDNPLARRFRDLLGMANQMIAKKADEVILMQSGIPITIKGGKTGAKIK